MQIFRGVTKSGLGYKPCKLIHFILAHIKSKGHCLFREFIAVNGIFFGKGNVCVFLIIFSSLILRLSSNFFEKPIGNKREERYHTSEYQN